MNQNPLKVSLENIIPLTEARDHFSQIVNEVQQDKLYVLTKGGKPAVAIVDVKYLEAITGGHVNQQQVHAEIQKNPQKVGLPEMVKHEPIQPQQPPKLPTEPPASHIVPTPPPIVQEPELIEPVKPTPPPPVPAPEPETPPTLVTSPPNEIPVVTQTPSAPGQLQTPPVEPESSNNSTIDIQVAPDGDNVKEGNSTSTMLGDLNSPDDKANPAQYAGEPEKPDVDDMPID